MIFSTPRRLFTSAIAVALLSAANISSAQQVLRVSAIPDEAPTELQRKFKPLGAYLEKKLNMKVEFTPVTDYAASVEGLINNKLDMVWIGSFTFVQAKVRSKDQVIALVQREEDEKFKSVFITTKADINKLEDLKGKTFTFGSESSTSGHLIQRSFFSDTALKGALEFLQRFAPPDLSISFLKKVFFATFETMAMPA